MQKKVKLVGLSGSLRKNSYNTAILKNIQSFLPDEVELEILDISKLPFYSEDIETLQNSVVEEFYTKISNVDGFVFANPEYNFSVAPVLKNAIDWASRLKSRPLSGKPLAIVSASLSPFGGIRAQYHLRQIVIGLNLIPLNNPEVAIPSCHTRFDQDGTITDEFSLKVLKDLIHKLILEATKK